MPPGLAVGRRALLVSLAFMSMAAGAQPAGKPADVHFIWMGGNDCPPCVLWRAQELPKLEKTQVFRDVQFSYVVKAIRSAVPPRVFLPDAVKPLKERLDVANAGRGGSPQAAVVVNGEVFDYFFGSRSAEEIEQMLIAARLGTPYPRARCLQLDPTNSRRCAVTR